MLEIRPCCENCGKQLLPDSDEAMICTFECTFCSTCVDEVLENVCPNCSGGFVQRPVRPKQYLAKCPPSTKEVINPVDKQKQVALIEKYKMINPKDR